MHPDLNAIMMTLIINIMELKFEERKKKKSKIFSFRTISNFNNFSKVLDTLIVQTIIY